MSGGKKGVCHERGSCRTGEAGTQEEGALSQGPGENITPRQIHTPGLDESIMKAITNCARCKNFGRTHLHALLQPITCRHHFELLVGNYLSMPPGKGDITLWGCISTPFPNMCGASSTKPLAPEKQQSRRSTKYMVDSHLRKSSCQMVESTSRTTK